MVNDSNYIIKSLYPIVEKALNTNANKFINNINSFMNKNHNDLYAIAPYKIILFGKTEVDNIYKSLGFTEQDILPALVNIWYWDKPHNPGCAKEPYILVLYCCVRYFLKKKDVTNTNKAALFLAFSGKIYASCHAWAWKYPPKKEILDYVINNMMTNKFDLKKEGNLIKTIAKLSQTWIDAYGDIILDDESSDKDVSDLLQQIRDRVKSMLNNIRELYIEAYNDKLYLNYETDDLDPDSFRLTSSDATLAARLTEAAMNVMVSQKVSMRICQSCANENVKAIDVKDIMEIVLGDKENLPKVRRVLNIIICDFMTNNPGKRVGSPIFITYTKKAKPNTKSAIIIELKETLYNWLEMDPTYRARKQRPATQNNYYKAILMYFTLVICSIADN